MTIEEIIAAIRRNQQQIQRAEERIASRKESIKEYEDTLLTLGVKLVDPVRTAEPLSYEELKAGLWYLNSCTGEDYTALIVNKIKVYVVEPWEHGPDGHKGCLLSDGEVTRVRSNPMGLSEIRREGTKFYWQD